MEINKEKIWDEIRSFSPWTENVIVGTLMAINRGLSVMNISPPGMSKTMGTHDVLDMIKIKHEYLTGKYSPPKLREKLLKGGVIVIDDSLTILRDKDCLNLLINALWAKKIVWEVEGNSVEENFHGVLIFNTNYLPKTGLKDALKDRIYTNDFSLNSDQIWDKIESISYKPNMEIWDEIGRRILNRVELDFIEIERVKDILKKQHLRSVRDYWRAVQVASALKAIFGDIDFLTRFYKVDKILEIIEKNIPHQDKVKEIAQSNGKSIRTAQMILKKYEVK